MAKTVGVVMTDRIAAGLIENHKIAGELRQFPEHPGADAEENGPLVETPADSLWEMICDEIATLAPKGSGVKAVGVALPGMIRSGVVEDSPNFPQLKGARVEEAIRGELAKRGVEYQVCAMNDADAVAAGLAATRGHLDRMIRVWTIGNGIGYGKFPTSDCPLEGGHIVVTLDPKENYCGCGGKGHLEGIMGYRAMRLRFMDMEPHEIFDHARKGDRRCANFVDLWHRALAAATASMIHLEGPGRFYFTGREIGRLDLARLKECLYQMVKMSPMQSYSLEVLPEDPAMAVIGAGTAAGSRD